MRIRLLGQSLPASIVIRAALEVVLLFVVFYGAAALRLHLPVTIIEQQHGPLWPRALTFSLATFACQLAFGLHSARQRARSAGILVRIVAASGAGAALAFALLFLFDPRWPVRGVMAFAGIGAAIAAFVLYIAFARLIDERVFKVRVLVYGAGRSAEVISGLRRRADRRGFTVVGYVRSVDDGSDLFPSERTKSAPEPVFEGNVGLPELCRQFDVNEIVVALDDRRRAFPIRELLECRLAGVDVTELLTFLERESGRVRIDVLNPSWIIFGEGFRRGSLRQLTARVLDLTAGSIIFVLSIPAMLFTVLAIKLEDGLRAPVLYRQERVGLGGRPFSLMKFRSMNVNAEASGEARWAQQNDPRVTRVGAVTRKLRIDELPQVLNVLRGDMSLVGPRPERPEFVASLAEKIPYYVERHCVKPGITGWAQLCYPYGSSEQDALEKLQYDLYYIKNNSLLLDLSILVQTAEVAIFGKGAR
ncbi:MAG TPA: TIGR03013 family XrtA/PEP-CTERM system glycosyltransferase [Steroidobacteraceae bacterium]|jgi:sugar transferase (PEP-CTERM system associated)|nr:TIGR03013 family XrtA/PEP-CTERM system glycosyltransferase [Steroidobacteraceae bacterium]